MPGVCGCTYGLSPCTGTPAPGGTLCPACVTICVPLSKGINPFDPDESERS